VLCFGVTKWFVKGVYNIYVLNRGDGSGRDQTHFTDLGELEQSAAAFHHDDAVDLSPSILFLRCLFLWGVH
jgi:hypothetical protein